ncbi:MAG: nitroreductase [Spirochaetaceae bacterium]|nr:nitroreductase [Spirochaetaceae bacterium]
MNNEVLKAISERRSIRHYTDYVPTKAEIETLLKAGMEAPSAKNDQPWHFAVCTNKGLIEEIDDEVRRVWGGKTKIFYNAPLAFFISCNPGTRWGRHDVGICVENICLAAHSIGLGTVILGMPETAFLGPKGAGFAERLKFPAGYTFCVAIAIGKPASTKEAHPIKDGLVDWIE